MTKEETLNKALCTIK